MPQSRLHARAPAAGAQSVLRTRSTARRSAFSASAALRQVKGPPSPRGACAQGGGRPRQGSSVWAWERLRGHVMIHEPSSEECRQNTIEYSPEWVQLQHEGFITGSALCHLLEGSRTGAPMITLSACLVAPVARASVRVPPAALPWTRGPPTAGLAHATASRCSHFCDSESHLRPNLSLEPQGLLLTAPHQQHQAPAPPTPARMSPDSSSPPPPLTRPRVP